MNIHTRINDSTHLQVCASVSQLGRNKPFVFDRIEHPNGVVTADVVQPIAVPER
jgi:hypothetical protein